MYVILIVVNRVKYEYSTPTTFEEQLNFTNDAPYILRIKRFSHEDVVPLHYAKTIEILLAQDLRGIIVVGNHNYSLGGKQLFVIPPNTVHANNIQPGEGTLYVLKMDFEVFSRYANIENILGSHNTCIANLANTYPEEDFDQVFDVVMKLIQYDSDFSYCISLILKLFSILKDKSLQGSTKALPGKDSRSIDLHRLIQWTQENLSRKISLNDVAEQFGYSKCYFCSRFKSITGFTYYEYLTSARISYSCKLLQRNTSVQETCYMAGFENVSYFVQLFKKRMGMTPREYAKTMESLGSTVGLSLPSPDFADL